MQKGALVGTILVIVALIMVGLSLIMPWYMYEVKMSAQGQTESMGFEFYLDHAVAEALGESDELDYDEEEAEDYNWVQTFKTTQILAFLGIIGCFIGLIGALMVTSEKLKSKAGAVLVLLAVILSLIAPLYLMFNLPNAIDKDAEESGGTSFHEDMRTDFFGSDEDEFMGVSIKTSWGGSAGWFLTIFAVIVCLIAFILVITSKPAPAPTYQQMPMPFDMYAQPNVLPPPQPEAQFYGEQTSAYPQTLDEPFMQPQGEEFQCPQCSRIFIFSRAKSPAILRCPYCGLEGLIE